MADSFQTKATFRVSTADALRAKPVSLGKTRLGQKAGKSRGQTGRSPRRFNASCVVEAERSFTGFLLFPPLPRIAILGTKPARCAAAGGAPLLAVSVGPRYGKVARAGVRRRVRGRGCFRRPVVARWRFCRSVAPRVGSVVPIVRSVAPIAVRCLVAWRR